MDILIEIRKFLKEKSNKKTKESWNKFIPTADKVYGVRVSEIDKLVSKYKSCDFKLVEELWNSGYLEERILAAKILRKIGKRNPDLTFKLIEKFSKDIKDWATCDTLATQGVRGIIKTKQKEIMALSKKIINSKNPWQRRFAIVLLTNFTSDALLRKEIRNIVKGVENDKEYYVRKAVEWLKRKL